MRPKNKKHKHFSRTDNKKYQEQNHKKEKTNNNNTNTINCCFFIAFASTIQFSHNTPPQQTTPTKNETQKRYHQAGPAYTRGDLIEQQPCCPRHPTACQTTKQTKTQTHFAQTLQPRRPKDRKSLCFINSHNPTRAHNTCAHTRRFPPEKTCHHQAPNQHPAMTKNLPLTRR